MNNRALHRFAVVSAAATFLLLGAGGLVTSHGVGMAVPDWPNTFGYNMFFFPFSQWVGGVFYEHSHRLIASAVGLCTAILAIWLHGRQARGFLRWFGIAFLVLCSGTVLAVRGHGADAVVLGLTGLVALVASFVWPRSEPARPWLRRLGIIAFAAVVLQGILGGLRVVLFKDQIGIFHASLAQLFFVLMCALALFTSHWWEARIKTPRSGVPGIHGSTRFSWLSLGATVLILAQLILGATMRHQHAGLAIPDFPLAYGEVWPAMDAQSVAHYNQQRIEVLAANPITSTQILLQMVHRAMAVAIGVLIVCCVGLARQEFGKRHLVSRLTLGWLGLITAQIVLGAATIWSNKAADIATAHVLVGALSLGVGAILSIILLEPVVSARRSSFVRKDSVVSPGSSFGVQPASFPGIE